MPVIECGGALHPAAAFLAHAETELAAGRRRKAVELLEQATGHDPCDDEAPLLASMICFEDGDLTRAASLALVAIGRRPFHPAAMNLLGVVCLDTGNVDLARKILARVHVMAPGLPGSARNLEEARSRPRQPAVEALDAGAPQRVPRKQIKQLLKRRTPRLSVCLAVEDPGRPWRATIESFEGLADQTLVADATADGCVAAAADVSVTVLRCASGSGRSDLLNRLLRRASGDWILVLRPDERLGDGERLLAELDQPETLSRSLEIRHAAGGAQHRELRLFRNAPGLRYEGNVEPRIHASIARCAGQWGVGCARSAAFIETPTRPVLRLCGSDELAERTADEDLRDRPDEPSLWLQRGRLDLGAGRVERALEDLARVETGLAGDEVAAEELVTLSARCLLRLEHFELAATRLESFHADNEPTRNTLYLQGLAARAMGRPQLAVDALRRALDEAALVSFMPPFAEILGAGLPNMLGAALLDLGRLDEAGEAFELARTREPGNVEARLGTLGLLLANGEVDRLVRELDALVEEHGGDSRVWSLGGLLLGQIPDLTSAAEQWMEEGCRRFPDQAGLRRQLGEAHLRCGHGERALEAWSTGPARGFVEQAARFAACLCAGRELPAPRADDVEAFEQEVLRWFEVWMQRAAYTALDRALCDIRRTETWLPRLPEKTASWLQRIGQHEAADRIRDAAPV